MGTDQEPDIALDACEAVMSVAAGVRGLSCLSRDRGLKTSGRVTVGSPDAQTLKSEDTQKQASNLKDS